MLSVSTKNHLKQTDCGDCGVKPGQYHIPGCDVERCPDCGGQMISCGMINLNSGECNPDEKRDEFGEGERLPWTGVWPGVLECIEYGFYSKWHETGGWLLPPTDEHKGFKAGHWVECSGDDPKAGPGLNELVERTVWSKEKRKRVLPEELK
jgi:hypothetical protein